ncbi:MAG: DUF5953 family protein [Hyalangium sp.]|uniref:DUF5953 family protein n=1 Tax=Hyalangium sp. TaxID=2028555 RepID=UPI003899959A
MAVTRTPLLLTVYAPALKDDDGRPVATVHAMEHALPGLRLGWTISDEGQFIPLPQRDAWVAQGKSDGGFPLLCNADENCLITLTGYGNSARLSPGRQALLDIHADWPLEVGGLSAAEEVLVGIAQGAQAFWGEVTPDAAAGDIADQTCDPVRKPVVPPRGLPALKLFDDIRSPEIPYYLGWLNYWSAASARILGFPDPARDADLLTRSRRTATGGWVVRLTEAPLDLDNPSHLDAFMRAYQRFPEIGGRASP